jgi:hypothetical protein
MTKRLRTVVYEHTVTAELEAIFGTPQKVDEALRGFTTVLSRAPTAGTKISERVWFMPMDGRGVWTPIVAYYTFDDEEVWIMKIERAK